MFVVQRRVKYAVYFQHYLYALVRCSSIRLQELGPRLTLELMKVERGLCEGEVLYHSYVKKTQDEVRPSILLPFPAGYFHSELNRCTHHRCDTSAIQLTILLPYCEP